MAGYDSISGSTFANNLAASSGGALVHAGVMEEISDSDFYGNGAGNEGPAVLSLGLLGYIGGVTFQGNSFYCEEGTYSTETKVGSTDRATVRYWEWKWRGRDPSTNSSTYIRIIYGVNM